MDEERIERALRQGPVDEPSYVQGVRGRIVETAKPPTVGLAMASSEDRPALASPTRIDVRPRFAPRTASAPRRAALAQLAAVLALVMVVGALALPVLVGSPDPSGNMLDRLRATGSIRMLVPEGAPQTVVTGAVRAGFDIDVAHALAEELSLAADVRAVDVDPDLPASAWDVSVGMPDLGTSAESQPYAYWPAWLATAAGSGLTSLDAVAGHPICGVGSSVAEGWLRSLPPGAAAPPGQTVVRAADDDECMAALAEGRVDALVTNTLFDDELASRGLVAVGTEPVAYEPRVVRISATGEDAGSLAASIDRAIDRLRTSGRLADLSRQSFGGRDLTEAHP